ncbi:hypothetical protein [Cupriavidus metallidurans]|uniref:hypothetical protein n=1 Tax=Cupriavidus metallidurans TaxID=119219 RepID=UPI001CCCB7C5|nr:hypothetical protein [Cupriavidus metallidurans]UBM11686.1 hypothetical protein LAI70_15195 [Cupriavidus metallidurans]
MSWLLRQVEGFVLAVLLAVLLSVPTVRAQTLNSNGTLNWGITSNGPSTSTVVGTSLVIAAAAAGLALTLSPPGAIAGAGAATVALTGRAFTLAGQYVGPIAAGMVRSAISRGPVLTGAMLALATAMTSGGVSFDPATGSFSTSTGQVDPASTGWLSNLATCNSSSDAGTCALLHCKKALPNDTNVSVNAIRIATDIPPVGHWAYVWCDSAQRPTYKVTGGAMFVSANPSAIYNSPYVVPSTDADLATAAAAPAALAKVWDAGGCPQKVTTFRDTLSADDPCAKIISDPRGQWTPVTVPNGGSISLPSTTQTVTDSTGKVAQTVTTTPTAQVTPNTNQATMAASPVTVTPGSVVKTVTNNADGSQTTTTTTTASPSTSTDQPQDGTAAFNAGTQDLYTKKSRTWAQVLGDFQTAVKAAPWYQAATGFFNVSISGGACPHWTVPASKWTPALDAGVYVCSSSMMTLYQAGGIIVMIVAAWAAFRIAFL